MNCMHLVMKRLSAPPSRRWRCVRTMVPTIQAGCSYSDQAFSDARRYMYRRFKELHGRDDSNDICWFATSQTMNPRLSQAVVDAAMASDRLKASAEYLNQWREDVADFVPPDIVEGAPTSTFASGRRSRASSIGPWTTPPLAFPAVPLTRWPSRTARAMTWCSTRSVSANHASSCATSSPSSLATLKAYGVTEIAGDKFARAIVADEWARNNIRSVDFEFDTSGNYARVLPILMGGRAKLINSATLRAQLTSLERHVPPSGHEEIRKPQVASAHDDLAAQLLVRWCAPVPSARCLVLTRFG